MSKLIKVMIITITIVILLHSNYTAAGEQINLIDKKLSQGYIAPIYVNETIVLVDRKCTLYSFSTKSSKVLNWKLSIPCKKRIISTSLSYYEEKVFFIVDNVLYAIDIKTGKIKWEKELKTIVRGKAIAINNTKLIVLTVDDCLYALNIKDGALIWTYQNSFNLIRGLHFVSPVIFANKVILAPFSNGEIVAFNENGKKLWNKKLNINSMNTQLTDITNTPRIHGTIMVITNNSFIYGVDISTGNILWLKPLEVESISNIISNYSYSISGEKEVTCSKVFLITKNDKIIGINIQNGEVIWTSDSLIAEKAKLFTLVIYANTLWITSDKGLLVLTLPKSRNKEKIVKISSDTFHIPVFIEDRIYITTERNGIFSLKNRFVHYE